MENFPIGNSVIWRDPQPQDDIAGGSSRIVYKVNRPDGDHEPFTPIDNESQVSLYFDGNTCTDNGCSNSVDTQVNEMIVDGRLPADKYKKLEEAGFIVNGKCNTSEMWVTLHSGTNYGQFPDQQRGNYLYKPWDVARNIGMIPEKMLPWTRTSKKDDLDNAKLTPEMDAAAKLWKEIFVTQYEIIPTDFESLAYHLKQAPIDIITGVCKGWGTEPVIQACGISSGHAVLLTAQQLNEYKKIFDSYIPTRKRLAGDYPVGYAIKGVVILAETLLDLTHHFTMTMGMEQPNAETVNDSAEVKALQVALQLEGVLNDSSWPTVELVQKFGGYFGENTRDAVKRFQAKYGIKPTGFVGPLTLQKLNVLYSS